MKDLRWRYRVSTGVLVWVMFAALFGHADASDAVSVVVPADGIAGFMNRLMPYPIHLGKDFSGSFWVKSISNVTIGDNTLFFSSHIHGKDIKYTTRLGSRTIDVDLGSVDLYNDWEAAFRYDKGEKVLYVKPHLKNRASGKKMNQGEVLLTALFEGLSVIEYPIKIQDLNPITTDLLGSSLVIDLEVSDIYSANNQLHVDIVPTPQTPRNK